MLELIAVKNKMMGLILLVTLLPAFSLAQEPETDPAPEAKVTTTDRKIYMQFDNELVDADNLRPSLDYIFVQKEAKFKKMIRLREDFIPEVKKGRGDFSGR